MNELEIPGLSTLDLYHGWVSIAVTKTLIESRKRRKGFVLPRRLQSIIEGSRGRSRYRDRGGMLLAGLFPMAYPTYFLYIYKTKDHLPRDGTLPSGLGPPTSLINQLAHRPV